MKLPTALEHCALASQLLVPQVHSSLSEQDNPVPVNPVLHAQVKLPTVLKHCALASQLLVPKVHSLTSAQ
eukprot:1089046-Rhodomonas_salina.2